MSRSSNIFLPTQRLDKLPTDKKARAKAIISAFQNDTHMYNAFHWLFGGYLFMIEAEELHSYVRVDDDDLKNSATYDTFLDWLKDNLEWMPFGQAQAYKLKQVFAKYIDEYKLHLTPDADVLRRISNIDRIATIATIVRDNTVSEWLVFAETARLIDIDIARKRAEKLAKNGYTWEEITPSLVLTAQLPITTQEQDDERTEDEPTPEPPPIIYESPVTARIYNDVTQRTFWQHVPKIAKPSTVTVMEYDDGTINVTIAPS